jgi:hypothetical protein
MIRDMVWDMCRSDGILQSLGIRNDGANVHQADTVDSLPIKPALVLRWGLMNPGVTEHAPVWAGAGWWDLAVWVHDEPGDFDRVDRIIERLKTILCGIAGARSVTHPGWTLIQADWAGDSQDLRDDGYHTVTRNSTYRVAVGWR